MCAARNRRGRSPTREEGTAPYEGAVYVVPAIEYVDTSPPLETSLFDDPERLRTLMRLTVKTILSGTQEDERLIQAAEKSAAQGNGHRENSASP